MSWVPLPVLHSFRSVPARIPQRQGTDRLHHRVTVYSVGAKTLEALSTEVFVHRFEQVFHHLDYVSSTTNCLFSLQYRGHSEADRSPNRFVFALSRLRYFYLEITARE